MQKRRDFLRNSTVLASYLALNSGSAFGRLLESASSKNFGIQLYTLRDIINENPKGILKSLAGYGYTQIESYEGPQGIFWGMSPMEFKNYAGDLGMTLVSTHCDIFSNFEKKVEQAVSIGMKYIICPWVGPQKSMDDFKRIAALFNKQGEYCKKNGIQFAYHNHDYSFKPTNGVYPQDVLMQGTDAKLVQFEMDMYWTITAGEDPVAWMKKYPNRFKLAHIKERSLTPINDGKFESVDLGTGSIDYPTLIKKAKTLGLDYLVMEQEYYPNGSPLKAAEVGASYLKKIKF